MQTIRGATATFWHSFPYALVYIHTVKKQPTVHIVCLNILHVSHFFTEVLMDFSITSNLFHCPISEFKSPSYES